MTNLRDGLASEEKRAIDMFATGSMTASILSGADLQVGDGTIGAAELAGSSITTDKLQSGCTTFANMAANAVGSGAILTANVVQAGIGSSAVTSDQLGASAVTSVKQSFVSTGSPPTGGYITLAGTGTMAGGSTWVAYPTAFTAAPKVVTGITDQTANFDNETTVAAGSVNAGSFLALGSAATATFSWIAVGSGAF